MSQPNQRPFGLNPIEELPDPFLKPDGTRVGARDEWPAQRERLKALVTKYLYGEMPPAPERVTGQVLYSRLVNQGQAIAEGVLLDVGHDLTFTVDIIRPAREGRVPVITWNQFTGRHGSPVEQEAIRRGYAIAEFDKEQLALDGTQGLYGPLAAAYPGYSWGIIAMWAWMQSRVVDYLDTTDYADMDKIIATGHSRGGKVALCAAIYDERFALCAPNGSGCGGAGCFRFLGGRMGLGHGVCETAGSINDFFPFWWANNFGHFGVRQREYLRDNAPDIGRHASIYHTIDSNRLGELGNEACLPFDLHTLKALIAPRALITTDALMDTWANPYGTQVTWRAAQEVYDFLGVPNRNALHFRDGDHAFDALDWLALLDFADTVFFDKPAQPHIAAFPPLPEDGSAPPALDRRDWRSERLHYSWRNPNAK